MKNWNRPEIEVLDINETASGDKEDRYEGDPSMYNKGAKAPNGKNWQPNGGLHVVADDNGGEPAVDALS